MKNKIIAFVLTVVMAMLALAGCASSYNYAEENLDEHVTFDAAAFKEALQKIEIEDSDFTTDEETRKVKVVESILSTLATYAEKNGEQKKDGALGVNDILYYAYYTTYEIDGKTYSFDMAEMKTTDFSSSTSTVKSKHKIDLSSVDVNDEDADELSVALKNAILALEDKTVLAYKTVTTSGLSIKNSENKANYKSVYVSYTREYNVDDDTSVKEEAKYEKIDLSDTENEIVKKLLDANTTAKIGSEISIKNGDVTEKTFTVVEGAVSYKYSSFKILFAVEEEGVELVTFEYAPYTAEKKLEPDSLYTADGTVTVPKDAKLTYHVYPVYYYQVSEVNATSIIIEALAADITVDSLEIFSSEEYKNGDKTVKALVEELVKIQDDASEDETLKPLKEAYDKAAAAVKDAGDNATSEQEAAEEAAEKAYNDAKKKAIADKTAEILAATKADADPIADVIVEQYKDDVYHTLKEAYDKEIVDKIGSAIWELVEKSVTVNSYPESLIEEAVAHLENEYEYKFYNENVSSSTTSESNYTAYNGDFDAYMVAVTKASDINGVPAKLEAEAKTYVEPIIKLYVASKALASDAEANMLNQLKANEFTFYDDNEKDFAYYCAENFVVDNDVLNKYKQVYGQSNYDIYVEGYGEANLRTALQANNFFDYLLCAKLVENKDGDDSHTEYTYNDEGKIAFHNIGYVFADETGSEAEE